MRIIHPDNSLILKTVIIAFVDLLLEENSPLKY